MPCNGDVAFSYAEDNLACDLCLSTCAGRPMVCFAFTGEK